MPALRNARHERFAQEVAAGKTLEEAHRLAGYNADRRNAQHLRERNDISHRVDELLAAREQIAAKATERAIEKTGITKAWVMERLRENVERAMQAQEVGDTGEYKYDGAVANRALELLGREIGMFISRSEQGRPGEFAALDDHALNERIVEEMTAKGIPEAKVRAFLAVRQDENQPAA